MLVGPDKQKMSDLFKCFTLEEPAPCLRALKSVPLGEMGKMPYTLVISRENETITAVVRKPPLLALPSGLGPGALQVP